MASEESILAAMQQPLTVWKRPEHLKEPRIWYKENGVVVRDLTPDLYPFAIEHMVNEVNYFGLCNIFLISSALWLHIMSDD
jgi:hypothetical protein